MWGVGEGGKIMLDSQVHMTAPDGRTCVCSGQVCCCKIGMQACVMRRDVIPYLPKCETNGTALQRLIAVNATCLAPAGNAVIAFRVRSA